MIYKSISHILFLSAVLVACTHQTSMEISPLYERFINYKKADKGDKIEKQFYSQKLWSEIQKTRTQPDAERGLSNILLQFPSHITQITGSEEITKNDKGCLMVMGTDNKNTPTDYYISFTKEGGRWVFDEIQIKYFYDGTQRFLKEAVCDEDKQNQLWIEFMQSQQ
jgi:hypothetical protein